MCFNHILISFNRILIRYTIYLSSQEQIMLYSEQIRAARSMLKITAAELAEITGLALITIQRMESNNEFLQKASMETVSKIKNALEKKGIKFLAPQEKDKIDGVGVRYFPDK